jgi:hypothetical protein
MTGISARLPLPERRLARSANGVERQAGSRLTAIALDLQPGQAAVDALADRRRKLQPNSRRWPQRRLLTC